MFLRQSFGSLVLLSVLGVCVDAAPPEPQRDHYGDPLPEGAVARLGSVRLRNEEGITAAAYTADGKTVMAAGGNFISFWDPVKGELLRRVQFKNTATRLQIARFSADGRTLIQTSSDYRNILRIVDASSGAERRTLNYAPYGLIHSLDVSRDGKIVAIFHERSIVVWDVSNGKLLHEFKDSATLPLPWPNIIIPLPMSWSSVIALTPDGKQLILPYSDGSLRLVEAATGKEVRALEMSPARSKRPPSQPLQRLIASPDGRYLAISGWGYSLSVCELATGKHLFDLPSPQGTFLAAWALSPNGRVLAAGSETAGIRLYDVPSGKEIRKLPLTDGMRNQLFFAPDGRTLVAMGGCTIKPWDMTAHRWLHPHVGHEGGTRSLIFFPDGKRLVCADYGNAIKVWDIASDQIIAHRTNTALESLAVDRDGESVRFAGYDTSVHRWEPRTDREEVQKRVVAGLSTNMLVLSPDGRSLAMLIAKRGDPRQNPRVTHQLRLYDLKTNKFMDLPWPSPQIAVSQMLFTPDSRRLAARGYGNATRLWDRATGKLVYEFKRKETSAPLFQPLSFAADGRSFLTWSGGMVRVFELAGRTDRLQIPVDPNSLNALIYAPDARFIACGLRDGRILVYSTVNGRQLAQWQGKQGAVHSLVFSRDSRLLASGGANGTILIWKVPKHDSVPLVQNAEEAVSLWQALGESDAVAANRALAGLAATPAQALPIFKERLRPIGKPLDREQMAQRIAELDDDSFKVREQATRELAQIGVEAADALRQALSNNPSAEAKRRIEDLLARLKKGDNPERLRFLRALEVLERIGTPPAKEMLRELAGKPMSDELSEEVQAGLRRMDQRP